MLRARHDLFHASLTLRSVTTITYRAASLSVRATRRPDAPIIREWRRQHGTYYIRHSSDLILMRRWFFFWRGGQNLSYATSIYSRPFLLFTNSEDFEITHFSFGQFEIPSNWIVQRAIACSPCIRLIKALIRFYFESLESTDRSAR